MTLSWGNKRKLLYGSVAIVILLALAFWLGFTAFSKPPSCLDGKQNQGETGVDCGGPCSHICAVNARAPLVLWQRAFLSGPQTYTAVAYVQNPNAALGAGSYRVPYAFRLYDTNNLLITEKDGSIDIPPQQMVPIIETNIFVGNRPFGSVDFAFSDANIAWIKIPAGSLPQTRITNLRLQDDGSAVTATVVNDGTIAARELAVTAVLFGSDGNALAASKSVLSQIPAGGSQRVDFTWTPGIPNVIQAVLTPIPALPPLPAQ